MALDGGDLEVGLAVAGAAVAPEKLWAARGFLAENRTRISWRC